MGSADHVGARALARASMRTMPDGTAYRSLAIDDVETIAADFGVLFRDVEIAALGAGVIPERYVRNFNTIDIGGQARLLTSRAVLIGLGGLGGLLLESLIRMGVGIIEGADGDSFEASNLNRQLTSVPQFIGVPKVQAAIIRAMTVNPSVEVTVNELEADEEDMVEMCKDANIVIDALGGLDDRPALQRAAARAKLPLVTAGIAGFSGYVATVMPGQPGPADFLGVSGRGGAAEDSLGSPAPGVYTAASIQSAEVMQLLATGTSALVGKMLLFDLRDMSFETIDIA